MQYLCMKQLTADGVVYYPGEIIPDDVILPERSGKLIRSGYISEMPQTSASEQAKMFTLEEVNVMIADAVAEVEKKNEDKFEELQNYADELNETESETYMETVQIVVKGTSNGETEQVTAISAKPDEIQQVFSIMQLNAEEGAKAVSDVTNENVLILLRATDSRKTIKNAAKEQADKLFHVDSPDASVGSNASTDTNTEGDGT